MTRRKVTVIALAAVVLGGGLYFLSGTPRVPEPAEPAPRAKAPDTAPIVARTARARATKPKLESRAQHVEHRHSDGVVLRAPRATTVTGVEGSLSYSLPAYTTLEPDEAARHLTEALTLRAESSSEKIPVVVTSRIDDRGVAEFTVVAAQEQPKKEWYRLTVERAEGPVELPADLPKWEVRLFTGEALRITAVSQPAAPKDDVISMRFTQRSTVDIGWASKSILDAQGHPIEGCIHYNGECRTSGTMTALEVSVQLPAGKGTAAAMLAPLPGERTPPTVLEMEPCRDGEIQCMTLE